jgi:hypothetical protein
MKKKFLIAMLFLVNLGCKIESDQKIDSTFFQVKSNQLLNLTEFSSLDSKVIDTISKDEIVEIIKIEQEEIIDKIKGKWFKIRYKEKVGYLFSGNLKSVNEAELDFLIIDFSLIT